MVVTRKTVNDNHHDEEGSDARNQRGGLGSLALEQLTQLIKTAVRQVVDEHVQQDKEQSIHEDVQKKRQDEREEKEETSRAITAREEDMIKQIDELKEQVKRMKDEVERSRPSRNDSSFSRSIVKEPLLSNYKPPRMREYNGSTDQEEHLGRFENAVMLHCYPDRIKCKVFLTTLEGAAQQWLGKLGSRIITSFEEFSNTSLHHFNSSKKHRKTTFNLFDVKQGGDESLREYIRRFNTVALEVPECPVEVRIIALTQGLRGGDLFRSFVKKQPRDFDDLLARAEKYINVEEAQKQKRDSRRDKGKEVERPHLPRDRRDRGDILGRFSHYTPLKISKEKAVQICEEQPTLKKPQPAQAGLRLSFNKFCTFHQRQGHDTSECQRLNKELERAMKRNTRARSSLTEYENTDNNGQRKRAWGLPWVQPNRGPMGPSQPHAQERGGGGEGRREEQGCRTEERREEQTVRGVINMISGGSIDGDYNRAKKAWSRRGADVNVVQEDGPVISFGPRDIEGIQAPHNDALVIRAMVVNYEVGRVLVDSGSSVNIIFQEAFNQMELGGCKLEPVDTSLFGFADHSIVPKGEIIISLSLRSGELRKTRMTPFTIVDAHSSYNIILGRLALSAFMAVASTCHQKIKFSVGAKVGEVRGNQSSSRKCYVETIRVGKKKTKMKVKGRESEEMYMIREGEQEEVEVVPGQTEKIIKMAKGLEDVGPKLIDCLRRYSDVFAWYSDELKGISPLVAEHKLNVTPGARPVK